MKRKALYMLIAAFSLVSLPSFAEWDKETKKEFSKAGEYRYSFDMEGTDYCGMDSISFVEYNAAKNNMTPENFGVILKYLGTEIKKSLEEETHKRFAENCTSKYAIHIHLDEITEKAGMKVTVSTYADTPENGQTYIIKVKDGRWNKFDILLQENAESLAKKIKDAAGLKKNSFLSSQVDNKYDPLYN